MSDSEYAEGLRAAVSAALDYGLAGLDSSGDRAPPLPAVLRGQARLAARNRISLDMVLRRYFAGYALLGDFILQEFERGTTLSRASLRGVQQAQAALFDRLIAAVTDDYLREAGARLDSTEQRRAERVQRLIAGEPIDSSELEYDLTGSHLGVVVRGSGAEGVSRELAASLGRRLLLVRRGEGVVWAWLGSRRALDPDDVRRAAAAHLPPGVTLACGEPGRGLDGWRLTHRQACAVMPVALRSGRAFARYVELAVLASMIQDDVLVASLRQLYLEPLGRGREEGGAVAATLRAYFEVSCNMSSAAAALGVSRRTVANRLRLAEERLGRSLKTDTFEIEAALRLQELESRD